MKRPHTLHPHRGAGRLEMDEPHDHDHPPAMLTVHDVARILGCSARTVYRLTDSGRVPRPVKLGSLVRWPRETIEQWIAQGCPRANQEEVTV